MRIVTVGIAVSMLAGCAHEAVESPPAGIPYACGGRAPIRVAYDGGGARAKAWMWLDGRKIEMISAPTLDGLRYMQPVTPEDRQTLAWATDGVEATLLEVPVGAMGGEADRLLATCRREGWDGATVSSEPLDSH